jgi:hypothetical protein
LFVIGGGAFIFLFPNSAKLLTNDNGQQNGSELSMESNCDGAEALDVGVGWRMDGGKRRSLFVSNGRIWEGRADG